MMKKKKSDDEQMNREYDFYFPINNNSIKLPAIRISSFFLFILLNLFFSPKKSNKIKELIDF